MQNTGNKLFLSGNQTGHVYPVLLRLAKCGFHQFLRALACKYQIGGFCQDICQQEEQHFTFLDCAFHISRNFRTQLLQLCLIHGRNLPCAKVFIVTAEFFEVLIENFFGCFICKAAAGADQAAVLERVENTLRGWFTGARLGQSVLRARLGNLIFQCAGVENYVIVSPAADAAVQADVLPVLGTLTVEAMVVKITSPAPRRQPM